MSANLPTMHYIITFTWAGNAATFEGLVTSEDLARDMRTRQVVFRFISGDLRRTYNIPTTAAIAFFALEPNEIAGEVKS